MCPPLRNPESGQLCCRDDCCSRVVLNLLLGGQPDLIGIPEKFNLIVFANRRVHGHFDRPLHAEFLLLPPISDCLVCSNKATPDITQEADRILAGL